MACKGGELKKNKTKKTTTKKDVHYLKKHHEVSSDTITAGQVTNTKKKISSYLSDTEELASLRK